MIYFNHQEKSQKRLILSQNFHLILVNIKLICLIILLGIIIVVLSVFVVLLSLKCRKKVKKQNSLKDEKCVSEDDAFGKSIKEVGIYEEGDENLNK